MLDTSSRRTDALSIPPGWLCYLAPEVMRCLKAHNEENDQLPFTMASDVYSFGYESYPKFPSLKTPDSS